MNARFEPSALPTLESERLTRVETIQGQSTDTDFRLPDEPNLPPGYTLKVGGAGWYEHVKTGMDMLATGIVLLVSLPVVLISAALVRITSRGPAFYTQMRLGRGGKPYVIYKLRSMYHDCERFSGIRWSSKGDNRVTPFGKFLRKSHIDELPQLWNVLRGEMSLIGPRPERPELVGSLEKALPRYRDRLLVKPGLTGLAQIQLPPDSDIESVRKKLVLDRVYVNHRSLWLDLRIYVATVFYLSGVSFETLQRWFALPHELDDEKQKVVQSKAVQETQRVYPLPVLDQV
jgi:lipopolysaccharide/colanic/teichoic acid biosynthesis glycosyltransferase